MKKQTLFAVLLITALMASCSDNYLNREYQGGTMNQEQYDKLNTLGGSMRGIYAIMYESSSSSHDAFGHRSIDLYGDMLSGDIALTNHNYGWFYTDEQMRGYTARTGYLWSYYYRILRNVNKVLAAIKVQDVNLLDTIATYGYPSAGLHKYSEKEVEIASYYAQALTMRGYAYSALVRQYVPVMSYLETKSKTIDNYLALPIYTEDNLETPQEYSTAIDVYKRLEQDLTDAIEIFTEFEADMARNSKLEADVNVARGLLAYAYLNKGYYYKPATLLRNESFTKAEQYAAEVIGSGSYQIIPNAHLLTTGFNNVDDNSWIWGQDVTVETQSGLCSFFGQMDIFSYSYPWAGDTKVIDDNLYAKFVDYPWDGRKYWFNDGKEKSKFKGCPSGKFFSSYALKSNFSTADDAIDREWLSDNVFMRVELMYLIAAEAEYQLGDYGKSADYLNALTDERQDLSSLTAPTEYAAYQATLGTADELSKAIEYNWRIEMWGEGYALQSFRRAIYQNAADKRTRGNNHLYLKGTEITPDNERFTYIIPSSETTYNPNLQKDRD